MKLLGACLFFFHFSRFHGGVVELWVFSPQKIHTLDNDIKIELQMFCDGHCIGSPQHNAGGGGGGQLQPVLMRRPPQLSVKTWGGQFVGGRLEGVGGGGSAGGCGGGGVPRWGGLRAIHYYHMHTAPTYERGMTRNKMKLGVMPHTY